MMEQFKAKIVDVVESYRLMTLTNDEEGNATLSAAEPGGSPDFYSTGKLEANAEVMVQVKGNTTWRIEAGEALKAGQLVGIGAGGVVVPSAEDSVGYVTTAVEKSAISTFVKRGSGGGAGDKGPTGNKGADGAPGAKGPVGDKGPDGDKGATGDKGPDGDPAPTE